MLRLEEQHSTLASEREQLAQELTSIQELVMAQDAASLDDEGRQAFAELQAQHSKLSAQVAAIVKAAEVRHLRRSTAVLALRACLCWGLHMSMPDLVWRLNSPVSRERL